MRQCSKEVERAGEDGQGRARRQRDAVDERGWTNRCEKKGPTTASGLRAAARLVGGTEEVRRR
jgi:hypothetical protein